jgi:hypothetical protein
VEAGSCVAKLGRADLVAVFAQSIALIQGGARYATLRKDEENLVIKCLAKDTLATTGFRFSVVDARLLLLAYQ